jgi:hypothetical protein
MKKNKIRILSLLVPRFKKPATINEKDIYLFIKHIRYFKYV